MKSCTPKKLDIYLYGAPVLRDKVQPVERMTDDVRQLIDDMILTMYEDDGIGLSANQVGRSVSLFVVGTGAFEEERPDMVFINPEILEMSEETETMEEGCLSVPDIREEVTRPTSVRIRFNDPEMKVHVETFTGFPARVIQHENDHLNGIFFTDRIRPVRRMLLKRKLAEIALMQGQ
jgi:peptide deformylase